MTCHPSPDVVCYAHAPHAGMVGPLVVLALIALFAILPALIAYGTGRHAR